MTKEEVEKILHDYIMQNLSIELEATSDWYSNRSLKFSVRLGKDTITTNSISL